MKNFNIQIKKLKKTLNLSEEILGVTFIDAGSSVCANIYRDTACTAIARVFKNSEVVRLSEKNQLCSGANYFLGIKKIKAREAVDMYVKKEKVFKKNNVCQIFLKSMPRFPIELIKKDIIISPFVDMKTQVIIFLVNPAQANRLLGLLNFDQYMKIDFLPNQSTCISLFAPLATGKPHINFIDYFDRYYQGKINKKHIWLEEKMIISLNLCDFKKILKNLDKSPQGSYEPKLFSQKVDEL